MNDLFLSFYLKNILYIVYLIYNMMQLNNLDLFESFSY